MNRKMIILCIVLIGGGVIMGTIIYNIIDYFEFKSDLEETIKSEIKYDETMEEKCDRVLEEKARNAIAMIKTLDLNEFYLLQNMTETCADTSGEC